MQTGPHDRSSIFHRLLPLVYPVLQSPPPPYGSSPRVAIAPDRQVPFPLHQYTHTPIDHHLTAFSHAMLAVYPRVAQELARFLLSHSQDGDQDVDRARQLIGRYDVPPNTAGWHKALDMSDFMASSYKEDE